MKIQLRFFASVREALGIAQETVTVPQQVQSVGDVREFLIARGGVWAEVLAEGRALRMAYDHVMTRCRYRNPRGWRSRVFPAGDRRLSWRTIENTSNKLETA